MDEREGGWMQKGGRLDSRLVDGGWEQGVLERISWRKPGECEVSIQSRDSSDVHQCAIPGFWILDSYAVSPFYIEQGQE